MIDNLKPAQVKLSANRWKDITGQQKVSTLIKKRQTFRLLVKQT